MCVMSVPKHGCYCQAFDCSFTLTTLHLLSTCSQLLSLSDNCHLPDIAGFATVCRFWVGSSMFGWLADKYGRKRCLLLSNAASCATAVLCASSSSYTWYVVSRTALGFCCPGLPVASYVLSTEAVGPQYRGRWVDRTTALNAARCTPAIPRFLPAAHMDSPLWSLL